MVSFASNINSEMNLCSFPLNKIKDLIGFRIEQEILFIAKVQLYITTEPMIL